MKNRTNRAMQVPEYSTPIPKRQQWPLRPPQSSLHNQIHFSLDPEQVNYILDSLFYTVSEAMPYEFRKKKWAMIHLVRCTIRYQISTFESEGCEEARRDER